MTYTAAQREKVVAYGMAQVGKQYKWLGVGPTAFDCSGLTLMAWKQVGLTLPHQSGQQVKAVHTVPYNVANRNAMLIGDLVFYYGSLSNPASVSHVALYVGKNPKDGMHRYVVAAVDEQYGVKYHWIHWALVPIGLGYVGH